MIYSVALGDDFADKLTAFILDKHKNNPFDMANTEIILPTRRACLTVKESFLRASKSHSLLLPKLTPLYEMDDLDEDLPPKMSKLNRTFLLAKLCLAKPNITSIDKAVMVAVGLGELLDEFYQYESDVDQIRHPRNTSVHHRPLLYAERCRYRCDHPRNRLSLRQMRVP